MKVDRDLSAPSPETLNATEDDASAEATPPVADKRKSGLRAAIPELLDRMGLAPFTAQGRVRRGTYFLSFLAAYTIVTSIFIAFSTQDGVVTPDGLAGGVYLIAVTVFGLLMFGSGLYMILLNIQRLHDLGQSGWLLVLAYAPGINVILWLVLFLKRGVVGPNKYGDDPCESVETSSSSDTAVSSSTLTKINAAFLAASVLVTMLAVFSWFGSGGSGTGASSYPTESPSLLFVPNGSNGFDLDFHNTTERWVYVVADCREVDANGDVTWESDEWLELRAADTGLSRRQWNLDSGQRMDLVAPSCERGTFVPGWNFLELDDPDN